MSKEELIYYMEHEEQLPDFSYDVNEVDGTVIILKKGVGGYFPSGIQTSGLEESKEFSKKENMKLGISEEQATAMKLKTMGCWN